MIAPSSAVPSHPSTTKGEKTGFVSFRSLSLSLSLGLIFQPHASRRGKLGKRVGGEGGTCENSVSGKKREVCVSRVNSVSTS